MSKIYTVNSFTSNNINIYNEIKKILVEKDIVDFYDDIDTVIEKLKSHTFFKEVVNTMGNLPFGESIATDVTGLYTDSDISNLQTLYKSFRYSHLVRLPFPEGYKFTVSDLSYMASNCDNLEYVPRYDYENVTNLGYTYNGCNNLKGINLHNTYNVTNFRQTFAGCKSVEYITGLDLLNSDNNMQLFAANISLKHVYIYNIKRNLIIGSTSSTSSYGTLITKDSYLHLCSECINTGSEHILYVHNNVIPMLDSIYVKFVDATQTDIPVDTKGSIVECSETDEGAFLLPEYLALKQWSYRKY